MMDQDGNSSILIFVDMTSEPIAVDFRGTTSDVLKKLADHPDAHDAILPLVSDKPVGVGRPKLGVVAGGNYTFAMALEMAEKSTWWCVSHYSKAS